MDTMDVYAKSAYQAYGDASGWKDNRGVTIPQWDQMHPLNQRAWFAVAHDVMQRTLVNPKHTKAVLAEHIVPFTTR